MDAWSSCAPLTSHYSTTSDPGNLGIRKACDAKKPVDVNDALLGNATIGPATFSAWRRGRGGGWLLAAVTVALTHACLRCAQSPTRPSVRR